MFWVRDGESVAKAVGAFPGGVGRVIFGLGVVGRFRTWLPPGPPMPMPTQTPTATQTPMPTLVWVGWLFVWGCWSGWLGRLGWWSCRRRRVVVSQCCCGRGLVGRDWLAGLGG